MEMTVAFVVAGLLGLPAVLWYLGRKNNQAWHDWEYLLDAKGARAYRELCDEFRIDRKLIDHAYGEALAASYRESRQETVRLLDIGFRFLSEISDDRERLLSQLACYARMISTITPPPPLSPRRFHLRRLVSLVGIGYILHQALVGASERFLLRIALLRFSFRIAVHVLFRSRERIARSNPDAAWALINAGREDFHSLSDESLESLRLFLVSLASARERMQVAIPS